MRQLALDLIAEAPPSLDNFIAGPNAEALAALRALAEHRPIERRIHVWGSAASGKTHLLRALVGSPLGPTAPLEAFSRDAVPRTGVIAVDDTDQLDDARQLALFGLFNRHAGPEGATILTTSREPPITLDHLRPELRTRLGSGLVLALRPLSDEEREQTLREAARASGVHCHDDVFRYLLTRKARDLRSLLAFFAAIDRYVLERKRPLSAALAREFDAELEAARQVSLLPLAEPSRNPG